MGKTTFLHSCLKTIVLRERRHPTVTISYCSFSRIIWQVEHRHVQHIRKWCRQQHEAIGGISRLIKWITLFKITRKGWSLTSTIFKMRKRNIMKTFKIKTERKLPRVQCNPKWQLMRENTLARIEPVPYMPWQQNSAKAKVTTLRPNLALKTG